MCNLSHLKNAPANRDHYLHAFWISALVLGMQMGMANYPHYPHWVRGEVNGKANGRVTFQVADYKVHFFLRNGVLGQSVWAQKNGLGLKHSNIKYDLTAKQQSISGDLQLEDKKFNLQLRLTNQRVEGDYSGARSGTISGRLYAWDEVANQEDPVRGRGWPQWSGPEFTWSNQDGHQLIDDFASARLVWRSEEQTPSGMGTISRARAGNPHKNKIGGGSSSPILADGLVFLSYHVPSGTVYAEDLLATHAEKLAHYKDPREVAHQKSRWLIAADDVILAIDARSGKTVWKQVYADGGGNWQDHKGGYMNNTMAYGAGKVFSIGSTLTIYCHHAKTGELVWTRDLGVKLKQHKATSIARKKASNKIMSTPRSHRCAGLFIDGKFILYHYEEKALVALDPKNGNTVWQSEKLYENTPGVWKHAGVSYLLSFTPDRNYVVCLNAGNGSELWRFSRPGDIRTHGPIVYENRMYLSVGAMNKSAELGIDGKSISGGFGASAVLAGTLSLKGFTKKWQTEVGYKGANHNPPVEVDGYVIDGGTKHSAFILDRETGAVLGEVNNEPRGIPGANGHFQVVGNKVLVTGDNHHGHGENALLGTTPETFRFISFERPTQHDATSPYSGAPTNQPYSDGRMYIRGQDGVYCYDLRKPGSASSSLQNKAFGKKGREVFSPIQWKNEGWNLQGRDLRSTQ